MALSPDSAKIQRNALNKVLDAVDLTPEALAKTFKDVGESPEKLRAVLNLWFTPWFKPNFVSDRDYAFAGLRDVDFLGTEDVPQGQLPYRMFDIGTGNLVEFPAIGPRGQYCMLSHRWKGVELTLGYVRDARKRGLERSREAVRSGKALKSTAPKSDVQFVLEQCRLDLEEQERLIRELCAEDGVAESARNFNIGDLLSRRLNARVAEDAVGRARDLVHQTRARIRSARMEQKVMEQQVFNKFVAYTLVHREDDEKTVEQMDPDRTPKTRSTQGDLFDDAGDPGKGMQAELESAEDHLRVAEDRHHSLQADIEYFQQHLHLRNEIDEMVCRLQRWKSAIKLERAIEQADHIFKTKLFQPREKAYLWTDTCCIDKANGGELSESLSLMGDWYAAAEYTLVQIDTPFRETDAIADWYRYEAERGGEVDATRTQPNIEAFEDIQGYQPEWSTRAWTLQELVMSKTTFYVNSQWNPLSRPIESLGNFYYLMPFIALYTRGDTRNIFRPSPTSVRGFWNAGAIKEILADEHALAELDELRENIKAQQVGVRKEHARNAVSRVEIAQHLIALLKALGLRVPGNLTTETATAEMARAVYLAPADIDGGLFLRLLERLPKPNLALLPRNLGSEDSEQHIIAQHAVKFLLHCLVAETEDLIRADREYVSHFGQVQQLGAWQQGTCRTGFPAQSVLEVSGKRHATVATDRSYALMGVLGVRFPTFPAEGYAKALARLLDEVVTTRNDVSVFNWTGMDMGSPIRGRSMYPSSHTAYASEGDRGRRYNLLLSDLAQDKVHEIVVTYHSVIRTLRHAIDSLKDRERKNIPFKWIERIVQIVQLSNFRQLKPHHEAFGKIVWFIRECCRMEEEEMEKKAAAKAKSAAASLETPKGFSLFKRPTMTSVQSAPSLPTSSLSFPGFKSGQTGKKEGDASETIKGSKFSGFGKGIKAPSFGLSKKGASSTEREAGQNEEAVTAQTPESTDFAPDPPPPYEETEAPPTQPLWQAIEPEVMGYLGNPSNRTLPPDLESIKLEFREDQQTAVPNFGKDQSQGPDIGTISPNPIIINNSGIEGLFDIQRVIVTMIDTETLRRQVALAASPHTQISGWCSISTGFARIMTSFACERRILEQQLDVVESVEARVLREEDKDDSEKRAAQLARALSVSTVTAPMPGNERAEPLTDSMPEEETTGAVRYSVERQPSTDTDSDNTDEERLVSRMIDFIQEPQLELIAGEWVLARFSGCPGANWFLCHLELGPIPGQLYGRRIAAGAIDFQKSSPEPGLVSAWQTYMERKKRKMCYILADYLRSRMSSLEWEERPKAGSDLLKGLRSPRGEKPSMEEQDEEAEYSADESDDSDKETFLDQVLRRGKAAAKMLGQYTPAMLAATEKLFEMRAEHLDKTLATAVLKRTPRSLRSAVENMNDNKNLLPAMFHSSTRVHMF
jgi:hypothetical protein